MHFVTSLTSYTYLQNYANLDMSLNMEFVMPQIPWLLKSGMQAFLYTIFMSQNFLFIPQKHNLIKAHQ